MNVKEEDKQQRETVNTRAQEILNEQMDEVKDMNKMLMYTKCVTIRDKQTHQNKQIREAMINEEKRKDLMWEIQRLKMIKQKDEEDKVKKVEQKEVCNAMIEQMKEKERKKLHEREIDEFEGLEITKAVIIAEELNKQQILAQKQKVALHKQQVNKSKLDHQMLCQ